MIAKKEKKKKLQLIYIFFSPQAYDLHIFEQYLRSTTRREVTTKTTSIRYGHLFTSFPNLQDVSYNFTLWPNLGFPHIFLHLNPYLIE